MSDLKLPELQGPTESIMQALQRNHSELLAALRESAADKQRITLLEGVYEDAKAQIEQWRQMHTQDKQRIAELETQLAVEIEQGDKWQDRAERAESELAIARDLIERHETRAESEVIVNNECPNCGAKGNDRCHDTEGPPARFVARHKSRPRLGDSTPLRWEYQGDGLVIYWHNPYREHAKETVAMMMWPSHDPECTEEVEQLYERMAETFITAWNGTNLIPAPAPPESMRKEKQDGNK